MLSQLGKAYACIEERSSTIKKSLLGILAFMFGIRVISYLGLKKYKSIRQAQDIEDSWFKYNTFMLAKYVALTDGKLYIQLKNARIETHMSYITIDPKYYPIAGKYLKRLIGIRFISLNYDNTINALVYWPLGCLNKVFVKKGYAQHQPVLNQRLTYPVFKIEKDLPDLQVRAQIQCAGRWSSNVSYKAMSDVPKHGYQQKIMKIRNYLRLFR